MQILVTTLRLQINYTYFTIYINNLSAILILKVCNSFIVIIFLIKNIITIFKFSDLLLHLHKKI